MFGNTSKLFYYKNRNKKYKNKRSILMPKCRVVLIFFKIMFYFENCRLNCGFCPHALAALKLRALAQPFFPKNRQTENYLKNGF